MFSRAWWFYVNSVESVLEKREGIAGGSFCCEWQHVDA